MFSQHVTFNHPASKYYNCSYLIAGRYYSGAFLGMYNDIIDNCSAIKSRHVQQLHIVYQTVNRYLVEIFCIRIVLLGGGSVCDILAPKYT